MNSEQYSKAELPKDVMDAIAHALQARPDLPLWLDFPAPQKLNLRNLGLNQLQLKWWITSKKEGS